MVSSDPTKLVDFLHLVSGFVDELLTVDLNLPDEPEALADATTAAPRTIAMLDRAKQLLIEIDNHYEPQWSANASDEDIAESDITPEQEICDLVFLCLNEIRPCRKRLVRAIQSGNQAKIIATSGEAYRRLNTALIPLENALARADGRIPPTRMEWDLEISLQVRRLYADLRKELQTVPDATDAQIRESLISFVLRFDDMKERDDYRFLRFDDRVHLDSLLKGTRAWLREGQEGDAKTGRRIWQELVNLVELMRQISIRTELRTYDRQLIRRACRELFDVEPRPEVMSPHLEEELVNLLGLDDELDWLIRNATAHPPKFWEHCLRRLLDKIDPTAHHLNEE